ncbi:MAG: glycosyltransferase family 9 protein [Planctomycetota bacterium]
MHGPQLADLPADARILAVRMSALGDIVFALPVLDALREALPQARIDWLVEDRHAAVLRDHPGIDAVLEVPRKHWRNGRGFGVMWKFLRDLKKRGQYDLVLDFQSNLKSALQLLHAQSNTKVGFAKPIAREGAQRFHHVHAAVPSRCHRSERDLSLLRALGWEGSANFQGAWELPTEVVAHFEAEDRGQVLLHTTTTAYGQDKLWPVEQWAALAQALNEEGAKVQLLWTPADRAKVEEVAALADGAATLSPATPSLAHLMALSDRAACLIGTDSGPVHLAAYRGTPVVALFGPTDPQVYGPPGEKVAIVYPGAPGEEPPKRDRSRRSPWMDRITTEMVMDGYQRISSSNGKRA